MPPVSCAFCNHENPGGAKYCNDCGSPLHLMICKCGAVNNLTDAHCHRCGAAVSDPRAPAQDLLSEAQLRDVEEQVRGFERQLEAPADRATQHASRFAGDPPAPGLDIARFAQQPQQRMPSPESSNAAAALPAGQPAKHRRGRRGYLAAALVLAIVAAAATGGAFYDRYAPWLALLAGALRGPVAAAPAPGPAATAGPAAAVTSPRAETAAPPMPPEPSRGRRADGLTRRERCRADEPAPRSNDRVGVARRRRARRVAR